MDIVTQGLLGAGLAQGAARSREARAATAAGLVAGLLPDADGLFRLGADPLLFLEYHRHFTHALAVAPVGAAVAALLAWPLLRRRLAAARLYLFALVGYAFAGVLDACTSYGTHLWWPFREEPVAWNLIAIVDPVFSLLLLLGVAAGLLRGSPVPARVALVLACAYLGLGAVQLGRAEAAAEDLAERRGHTPARMLVKPTIGNLLLWRSLYVRDGTLHADGIRPGLAGGVRVYPGESRPLLRVDTAAATGLAARDVIRFARFSRGLMVRHPERPGMVGDARFAMLPTGLRPLWGIEPDPGAAAPRARFVTDRSMTQEERARFLAMLRGRDVE